jgi:hypothetical protein
MQQALATELQTSIRSLSEELKAMKDKDTQEKDDIEQKIEGITKRLSTNVTTLDEAIDKQTRSLRDDVLSSHRKLQNDLSKMKEQLFENFEKRMSTLTSSKINREDMAEMLFEIVLKLKGTEHPQLKGTDFTAPWEEKDESNTNNSEYLLLEESQNNE